MSHLGLYTLFQSCPCHHLFLSYSDNHSVSVLSRSPLCFCPIRVINICDPFKSKVCFFMFRLSLFVCSVNHCTSVPLRLSLWLSNSGHHHFCPIVLHISVFHSDHHCVPSSHHCVCTLLRSCVFLSYSGHHHFCHFQWSLCLYPAQVIVVFLSQSGYQCVCDQFSHYCFPRRQCQLL